jgi:hypothetical protein
LFTPILYLIGGQLGFENNPNPILATQVFKFLKLGPMRSPGSVRG